MDAHVERAATTMMQRQSKSWLGRKSEWRVVQPEAVAVVQLDANVSIMRLGRMCAYRAFE